MVAANFVNDAVLLSSDLIVVKREVNGTTLLLETRVSAFENIRRLAKILPILRSLNNSEMLFDIYLLSHSIDGLDPRDFVHLSVSLMNARLLCVRNSRILSSIR